MLILKTSQIKLNDDGGLTYQPDATNPLPGEVVARVIKGADALSPSFEAVNMPEALSIEDLQKWWPQYLEETMEALVKLDQGEDISGPALDIAQKLKHSLGIMPRAEIEDLIGQLDEEGRRALRARKVKLGPILVFLYTLNKPAAVRLRALLWSLYNDKPLPADVPADGIVSATTDGKEDINHDYYRAIGYPVYGTRMVRIDMLDRVINSIYDNADKGKFKAQHEMAEWLGCSIPDLYKVLEAMGHRKIYDPAEEAERAEKTEETEATESGEAGKAGEASDKLDSEGASEEPSLEVKSAEAVAIETPEALEEIKAPEEDKTAETVDETKAEPEAAKPEEETAASAEGAETAKEKKEMPQPQEKPELATFVLKRGKANQAAEKRRPFKGGKAADKPHFDKNKKQGGKGKPHKGKFGGKKDRQERSQEPRVYSAGPAKKESSDSSPFAVLKQLKANGDD